MLKVRANSMAIRISVTLRQRTITKGYLSILPFHTRLARSYCSSLGRITSPRMRVFSPGMIEYSRVLLNVRSFQSAAFTQAKLLWAQFIERFQTDFGALPGSIRAGSL